MIRNDNLIHDECWGTILAVDIDKLTISGKKSAALILKTDPNARAHARYAWLVSEVKTMSSCPHNVVAKPFIYDRTMSLGSIFEAERIRRDSLTGPGSLYTSLRRVRSFLRHIAHRTMRKGNPRSGVRDIKSEEVMQPL